MSKRLAEVARKVGVSEATVSRVLKRFQQDGLLNVERREIELADRTALEALAETGILDARSRLPETTREHRAAEKRLNTVAEKLRAQGVAEVKVRVIEGADPPAEISRAIRAEQADFVAMTTRGSSGLKRFVLGSVAEKVVRESVVPVLLVTPR